MPKLYTKTGDKGMTRLYDMKHISKSSIIIDCLGDTDELSAHVGLLCAYLDEKEQYIHIKNLRKIQHKLLDIGSNIATVDKTKLSSYITKEDVKELENLIDECEKINTPLKEFILQGVKISDAQCNVCRTVCRRAERKIVNLKENNNIIQAEIRIYE